MVMKVTVAIDSFKGSLSSLEAGEGCREGILEVFPEARVKVFELADGGEGTVRAIHSAGGELFCTRVTGPVFEPVECEYSISPDGMAVIEMAGAAGLTLVPEDKRDPRYTTTYGVGELIGQLIRRGVRRFTVGLGGSATNDGGVGMLTALGFRFLNKEGRTVEPTAAGLGELETIDPSGAIPELSECSFTVASDVKNPLLGKSGASAVFAPQKGASEDAVSELEGYLTRLADKTAELFGVDKRNESGAGAAGGLGFAFISYLGARLESGIKIVSELIGLGDAIKESDIVITGEGRLDGQSAMGKAPVGVATVAKKYGKPCIALAGSVKGSTEELHELGLSACFSITRGPASLSECMDKRTAYGNIKAAAAEVFSLIRAMLGDRENV